MVLPVRIELTTSPLPTKRLSAKGPRNLRLSGDEATFHTSFTPAPGLRTEGLAISDIPGISARTFVSLKTSSHAEPDADSGYIFFPIKINSD
jgi:hypothetical protein